MDKNQNKVMCIGEMLIDFVCVNKGKSLEDGEEFIKKVGGAPFNVAVAIKKLGATPCIIGAVGNDQFGNLLKNTLVHYNINVDNVVTAKKHNTTLAFVSLFEDGERDFSFVRGADADLIFSDIPIKELEECKVFHFGSATAFMEGELNETYFKALEYGSLHNKIITFDPNYRKDLFGDNKEKFVKSSLTFIAKSDLVKVNEEEAYIISGENDLEKAGNSLVNFGAKFVLITIGKKGCMLCSKEGIEYIKTKPVTMVDATGAGDAFMGAVISQMANSNNPINLEELREFINLGNIVGGLTVQKYGALDAIPYLSEINLK